MNTTNTSTGTAQLEADEAAVTEHLLTGKPLDPEVYRRVRARAEQITAQLRQRYGDMNLAVDLIRDIRDEIMRYVLDSSVAIQWVLPEKDSVKAIRLRDDYHNAVHELLAPDLFPAEMLNALTKAERTRRISVGDARVLYQAIIADTPILYPYLPLMDRAGEVASRFRVAVYDCLYLALAERESCELVTADTRFFNNLQQHFPFLVDLASLP